MNLFYISISVTFYFFCYVTSEYSVAPTINHRFPIVYFLILLIYLSLLAQRKIKIDINKKHKYFVFSTVIVYVFLPLISFNVLKFDFFYNFLNIFFDFIFVIVIFIISTQMIKETKFNKVMVAIALGNGFFIIPEIIMNFSDIININNYTWLLQDLRIERASYGLRHANYAGKILLIQIFSVLFCFAISIKKRNKIILAALEIILLFALITTGNRTAVYSLLISIVIVGILFFFKRFKSSIRSVILVCLGVIGLSYFIFIFNWNSFYASSLSLVERYNFMMSALSKIPDYGDYFFGIAPLDQIVLAKDLTFLRNDNWFVQTIISYGLVGLVLIVSLVIYIYIYEIRLYFNNHSIINIIKIMLLTSVIVYSTMDITLFTHGISLSLFLWITILPTVTIEKN